MDECARETHNCDSNANCTNDEGIFFCTCNPGYTGNGTNGTCTDIDECSEVNQCDMKANCTNTIGNYSCACNPGYSGSGFQCESEIECVYILHMLLDKSAYLRTCMYYYCLFVVLIITVCPRILLSLGKF